MIRLADVFRLPGRKLTSTEAQTIAGPLPRYNENTPDRIKRLRKEAAAQRAEQAMLQALEMLPQALTQIEEIVKDDDYSGWWGLEFQNNDECEHDGCSPIFERPWQLDCERKASRDALLELLKAQGFKTRHCRETKRAYESWEVKLPK